MIHRYIFRMIRCAFCSCFPFTSYNRKSSLPASLLFMVDDDLGKYSRYETALILYKRTSGKTFHEGSRCSANTTGIDMKWWVLLWGYEVTETTRRKRQSLQLISTSHDKSPIDSSTLFTVTNNVLKGFMTIAKALFSILVQLGRQIRTLTEKRAFEHHSYKSAKK